jgi:hypothetical protein
MALPKTIEGTGEELQAYLKRAPQERFRLIHIDAEESTLAEVQSLSPPAKLKRQDERDPELVARVKSIRGKYAHLGVTTEDLHRERQADKEKEERRIQRPKSQAKKRISALGKYAFAPNGSEEFAREKQGEIEREDRPRS